jgi:hypothetical protein
MKLYEILASLSVYELNRLRKYVASPFFNEKANVLHLLDNLLPFFKQKNADDTPVRLPTKELLWASLHTQKVYNDVHFRRMCSDLVALCLDFFAYLELEKSKSRLNNFSLPQLRQRKLAKQHESTSETVADILSKNTYRNADFYYENYRLAENINIQKQQSANRTADNNLLEITENLDIFYLAQRLNYTCNIISLQNVMKIQMEMVGLTQIIALAEQPIYSEIPLIRLYMATLRILLYPDDITYFEHLKAILLQYGNTVTVSEQRELYTFALNYCIRKINLGKADFYQEIFNLYEYVLEKEILLKDGELPAWDYKNIVTLGLRLREYAWIEHFIQYYTPLLPPDFRENALNYNLAKLNFAQKNYAKVIELLQVVTYQDVFYNLDSRALLVKTYYELDETMALEAAMESFRIYLVRDKMVSETTRQQFLNFLKCVRKIINKTDKAGLKKLQIAIADATELADKPWLLGVITDLLD